MSFHYELRLSGEGGQGLVLAGKILSEAAAIHAGLNATQSQSYGPEARGGASRSEVIIADDQIDYPKAVEVDLLLALTQESYDLYRFDLKPDAIIVVDEGIKIQVPDMKRKVYQVPIVRLALEKLGKILYANVVALGVITEVSKVVPKEALQKAVKSRAPKGTEEKNLLALDLGMSEARKLL